MIVKGKKTTQEVVEDHDWLSCEETLHIKDASSSYFKYEIHNSNYYSIFSVDPENERCGLNSQEIGGL